MIDVIIIGAGGSGLGIHGRLLTAPSRSTKYRVVGFVDVDADKAAAAVAAIPTARAHSSITAALTAGAPPRLAIIATKPYASHLPIAIELMEAGVDVIVEKPFGVNLDEVVSAFARASALGRPLLAFQNRRWEVSYLAFRDALAAGAVGTPLYFELHRSTGFGRGDFLNMGTHTIDQLVALTAPDPPITVLAVRPDSEAPMDSNTGAACKATVQFASGLIADLHMLPAPQSRIHFYAMGDKGSFRQDWADEPGDLFRRWQERTGDQLAPIWTPEFMDVSYAGIATESEGNFYGRYYDLLHDHLTGGGPAPVPPQDTITQFRIVAAIEQAARERRAVTVRSTET